MNNPIRIGMVGLDTSHVVAFARVFNDPAYAQHLPGAKVVTAFPGGSPDFDLSRNRVEGFTNELRTKFGVEMVDSPEAVAEAVDLVLLESVDGRVHLEQFRRLAPFRKPTFIDKPLAVDPAQAEEIFRVADRHGVAVMTSSTLRYSAGLADAVVKEPVRGCDISGPLQLQPTQPGWYWYGVHLTEALVTIMGVGCRSVQVIASERAEVMIATWADGRVCTVRGDRSDHWDYRAVIHREKESEHIKLDPAAHGPLMAAVLRSLPAGKPDVPREQSLDIMRILDAANRSRTSGAAVNL